jgi:hypothetical protein
MLRTIAIGVRRSDAPQVNGTRAKRSAEARKAAHAQPRPRFPSTLDLFPVKGASTTLGPLRTHSFGPLLGPPFRRIPIGAPRFELGTSSPPD